MNKAAERRRLVLQEASDWLVRLQAADCTDADFEAWGQWLQASDQHAAAFDDVSALWEASSKLDSAEVLKARESRNGASRHNIPDLRRRRRAMRFMAGIAASVLVLAVAWLLRLNSSPDGDGQVFVTAVGERRHITLADGSTVDMDAATTMRIRYNETTRAIELREGQAFFSVAHAPERPFVVSAGKLLSRALGTQFAVSHRAKRDVAVTVVEGRVRVSQSMEQGRAVPSVDLAAGEQVTFSDEAGLQAPRNVNAGLTTAWREGVVIYQGESLANVIVDLNRYSTVVVRLEDPALGQLKVTGRWELAAIDRWVDGLARASGTRIKRSVDEILLIRDDD